MAVVHPWAETRVCRQCRFDAPVRQDKFVAERQDSLVQLLSEIDEIGLESQRSKYIHRHDPTTKKATSTGLLCTFLSWQ